MFAVAQDLAVDLDRILEVPALRHAIVAAHVVKADGTVVYSRNAGLRLVPASNEKLLTVSYALHVLGPNFRPKTKIWKLADRIVVDSSGDPMLTFGQLSEARRKLGLGKRLPVYVRQAYSPGVPPGWEWDDLPNRYAAPVTAFTVDRGSFELWSNNGKLEYRPATYGSRTLYLWTAGPPMVSFDPRAGFAFVTGTLPPGEARLDTLAIARPDQAAGAVLGGPVLSAHEVPLGPPTLTIEGPTISQITQECLTKSDNNIAEHLLLMAAHRQGAPSPVSYPDATIRLAKFLTDIVGLEEAATEPVDGSGLSRHNNVTAEGITKLLAWAERQPTSDSWMAALAKPGTGTLASRLAGSSLRGKTGSLDGASALSGYLTTAGGERLIVSLVFNHYPGTAAQTRAVQDEFIRRLEKGVSPGMVLASYIGSESDPSHPQHSAPHRHWFHRYGDYGLAARSGNDR